VSEPSTIDGAESIIDSAEQWAAPRSPVEAPTYRRYWEEQWAKARGPIPRSRLLGVLRLLRERQCAILVQVNVLARLESIRSADRTPVPRLARLAHLLSCLFGSPVRLRLAAHGGAVSAVACRGEVLAPS
jgi:hypothetical protein